MTEIRSVNSKILRSEVARYAGVSVSTVSCVLNNTRAISKKTREKVMEAVKALGYVPDTAARTMKLNKSYQLAIIVNTIEDPMFTRLISHFERVAMEHGYFVNICGGYGTFDDYITHLLARRIDGLFIAVNLDKVSDEAVRMLTGNHVRIAMGGHNRDYYGEKINFVNTDIENTMRLLLEHLRALGHRAAGYLSAFPTDSLDTRAAVFLRLHQELFGCEGRVYAKDEYVPPTRENGFALTRELVLPGLPTALVCTNDIMAIGAVKALSAAGLNCPGDVSVCGINNDIMAQLFEPEITSVGPDYAEFARTVFELLVQESDTGADVTVPVALYPRASTGPARR